jgi:N4-gp56 family major capsid protein
MAGQNWQVNALGGYLANPVLSRQVRHAASLIMKFRQFVRPEPGYGKGKGDTILVDRITQVATSGGKLVENVRIPESNVSISQQTINVYEYGNAIPYSGKLEALSEFSVDNLWTKALRDDMNEVLDKDCATEFQAAKIKYTPTGSVSTPSGTFDTDGTISTAATRDILGYDIKELVLYLGQTLKCPKYDADNYICICPMDFTSALLADEEIKKDFRYGDPKRLMNGEVGTWNKVRFVEETNVLSSTLGSTSYRSEAVIFGEDPVVEGVAVPGEIRSKMPEDYGRSKGVAWYALMGFKIVWDTAFARQARIIHVTST